MEKFEKLNNRMKHKAFGKTKAKTSKNAEDNGKKVEESEEEQSDKMEAEILKVKALKQGRTANVFKIREAVVGKKKTRQEAHAIFDEDTKELVVSNSEIKKSYPGLLHEST